jgi:hypothetical protein
MEELTARQVGQYKRTGLAAVTAIVAALILALMWEELSVFFVRALLQVLPDNKYVLLPFAILTKFGPSPFGAFASALLVRWMFPAANANKLYYALAAFLVVDGVIDVVYGGEIALVQVPITLITIAVTKSILMSGTPNVSAASTSQ